MKILKDCIGKPLIWKGLRATLENPEELFCGKDLVAKIVWKPEYLSSKKSIIKFSKKPKNFQAEGQTKEGKWSFERQGLLFNRKIVAKKSGKLLVSCEYYQTNRDLEIKIQNRTFKIRQAKILNQKYVLETKEKELISVEANLIKALTSKDSVKMIINPTAKSFKELPFLVLFFMYYLAVLTWDTRFS